MRLYILIDEMLEDGWRPSSNTATPFFRGFGQTVNNVPFIQAGCLRNWLGVRPNDCLKARLNDSGF